MRTDESDPIKKSVIVANPSKSIENKEETPMKSLELLESADVKVEGTVTAGTKVAPFSKDNIRKNTLRLGE